MFFRGDIGYGETKLSCGDQYALRVSEVGPEKHDATRRETPGGASLRESDSVLFRSISLARARPPIMRVIRGFPSEEIFNQAHLAKLGFTLEQFLDAPIATLKAAGQADAILIMLSGHRPLLPAQVALRRKLEAQWAIAGNPAEPHRHRAPTRRAEVPVASRLDSVLAA